MSITPVEAISKISNNLEFLRTTFNILQALINEEKKKNTGVSNCEAFTLAAASKIVYQRWEQEKGYLKTLPHAPKLYCTEFAHTPFSISEDVKNDIAKEIGASTWFKTVWPGISRG